MAKKTYKKLKRSPFTKKGFPRKDKLRPIFKGIKFSNPGSSSTVGSIVKWGAITLGAYFLSRSFGFSIPILSPILDSIFGPTLVPATPTGTTSNANQTNTKDSSNAPSSSQNTASGTTTTASGMRDPVLKAANASATTTMGWDQWNYYYNKVTGKFLSSKTVDRTKKYTIDQFFTLGGLSGIGVGNYFYNRGGVGIIANRDPYRNPRGQGVVGLFPVGPYAVPINSYSFGLRGLGDLLYKHGGEGARTTSDFKSGSGKPTGAEKMNIKYMN